MRRRRKQQDQDRVTLNLTAMLDMAFQLLAFFILTFRPPPIEGQITLHIPPPQATQSGPNPPGRTTSPDALRGLKTLVLTIFAQESTGPNRDAAGRIANMAISVGQSSRSIGPDKSNLLTNLRDMFQDGSQFDQILLQVDSRVRYADVMSVVEICSQQRIADTRDPSRRVPLSKLSFVELPASSQ